MTAPLKIWHHGLVARWWAEFNEGGEDVAYFREAIERSGEPVLDAEVSFELSSGSRAVDRTRAAHEQAAVARVAPGGAGPLDALKPAAGALSIPVGGGGGGVRN